MTGTSTNHCINLICCFQYEHIKTLQKEQIIIVVSNKHSSHNKPLLHDPP